MSQEGLVNIINNSPSIPVTFTTESGVATPAANNINMFAGSNLTSTGSGSTVTYLLTGLQNHSLVVGNGTSAFTNLGVATNGQLPIGSTGTDPVLATLTAGSGITITNGAGSITIAATGGSVEVETLTGNSGGAVSPTLGNINTVGTGSITVVGNLGTSTLTTQLTGLTNHNVQVGAGSATLTQVAPSATSGVPLVSNGSSSDPSFSTALIAGGGTASTSFNINGAVYSNTTTTGALQSATLTSGQLLIGGTTTPAAATLTAGAGISITNGNNSITIAISSGATAVETLTGNSGGAISPTTGNINTLGTGSITIAGSGSTLTTQLTGLTNHALQIGAGTATLTQLGPGTTGQVLQTNTTADPTWSTATYPSTTTINQVLYSSANNTVGGITAGNNGVLISSSSGVPSWLADGTTGQVLTATTGSPPSWANPVTVVKSVIPQGSAVTLTSTVSANITSISLTAGTWYISATVMDNSTLTSNIQVAISTSSAALPANTGDNYAWNGGANLCSATINCYVVSPGSTTTYYLVANANATGTITAWGNITAFQF